METIEQKPVTAEALLEKLRPESLTKTFHKINQTNRNRNRNRFRMFRLFCAASHIILVFGLFGNVLGMFLLTTSQHSDQ